MNRVEERGAGGGGGSVGELHALLGRQAAPVSFTMS